MLKCSINTNLVQTWYKNLVTVKIIMSSCAKIIEKC